MPAAHIERTYRRPPLERALRWLLARGPALSGALPRGAASRRRLGRPFAGLMPRQVRRCSRSRRGGCRRRARLDRPQVFPAEGARRKRVALLTGCAQRVLDPEINAATIRLLTRHGCEVVVAEGAGCCGALTHHMGKARPRATPRAAREHPAHGWREVRRAGARRHRRQHLGLRHHGEGLRPHVRGRPARRRRGDGGRARAGRLRGDGRARARGRRSAPPLRVAYHAACSLQHGQQVRHAAEGAAHGRGLRGRRAARQPSLLRLGRHLQPAAAGDLGELRARKVATLEEKAPQVIAAGNIGCMMQIGAGDARCRWCTPSSSSTGRPAGRGRRRSARSPDAACCAPRALLAGSSPAAAAARTAPERRMLGPEEADGLPRGRAAQHRRQPVLHRDADRPRCRSPRPPTASSTRGPAPGSPDGELRFVAGYRVRRARGAAPGGTRRWSTPSYAFGGARDLRRRRRRSRPRPSSTRRCREAVAPFATAGLGRRGRRSPSSPTARTARTRPRSRRPAVIVQRDAGVLALDCAVTYGASGAPLLPGRGRRPAPRRGGLGDGRPHPSAGRRDLRPPARRRPRAAARRPSPRCPAKPRARPARCRA